jgi:Galactose oxidase, central domain
MRSRLCVGSALCILWAGLASGQVPNWTEIEGGGKSAVGPPSRWGGGMAYDPVQSGSILFGGLGASSGGPVGLADTWAFNGISWTELFPSVSPSGRFGLQLAFDSVQSQIVLFGGAIFENNGIIFSLNDTWTWNGSTWTKMSPAASPPPRYLHGMAFDAATGQVVVFGGVGVDGFLGDTWVWNGVTWAQFTGNNPSPRGSPMMTYDAARQQVVLFGGADTTGVLGDTWVWNGGNWIQLSPTSAPAARYGGAFAYDAVEVQSILFGGASGATNFDDTWAWNGTNWTLLSPKTIPPKRFFTMVDYDSVYGQVVMYGGGLGTNHGDIYLQDTWVWK